MRFLLTFIGCCLSLLSLAQKSQRSLRIEINYEKNGQYIEQAVETIEAINKIGPVTLVNYQAGRSVTMLPGFEAKNGSTFIAEIKALDEGTENPLRLASYPNPFEQSTTIEYYLPSSGKVNLWVTNAQGQVVGRLIQGEEKEAGLHRIEWKPESVSSGVYIPIVEVNQRKAVSRTIKK